MRADGVAVGPGVGGGDHGAALTGGRGVPVQRKAARGPGARVRGQTDVGCPVAGHAWRDVFVFTSDNGPLYDKLGGTDDEFFNSAGGLRGRKGSNYEGGIRVPCVVRWKRKLAGGRVSDRVTGFEDWLPTLLELSEPGERPVGKRDPNAPEQAVPGIDGISFARMLQGERQAEREFLYREAVGYGGQQSLRMGDWKAIRTNLHPGPRAANQSPTPLELYNLRDDPREQRNVAGDHPDVVARMKAVMAREHAPSALFPIKGLDAASR